MAELAVGLAVPVLIALPHFLDLDSAAPRTAAIIWMLALSLRALVVAALAAFVFVYLPQTPLLSAAFRLCWHAVVPLLATHLGFSGHAFVDAAAILPGLVIAASVVWVLFGFGRAWLLLRAHVKSRFVGETMGCTVVEDDGIVVAVPSIGRAKIVVSRAALDTMDAEELEASIAHERAHASRGHRPILVVGSLLAAAGHLLPGTAAAEAALALSVERDADECAVRQTRRPLALASAICKAAGAGAAPTGATALAGRGGVAVRLECLLGGGRNRPGATFERAMQLLAALMAAVTIMLLVSFPAWAGAHPAPESSAAISGAQCRS